MPLSTIEERELLHTRRIEANGYARPGGLYDLEARLVDVKTHDKIGPAGTRRAGEPIHDMSLRITIDTEMHIVAAEACFDAHPYENVCDRIAPDYGKLVGLRIAPGLSAAVKERLGGTRGCTHMTDLIGVLATLAFQTMANQRARDAQNRERPFQLNRCHALATTGEVVRRYYPRWYASIKPAS
ncbi:MULTISPECIES: DUF2889 domain-containing protein [unclassified Caballeronia]|uniref:DUF2889 domain-containing protein n=1 Tax=unclassified Caballeronia TaxID=2646786 RepID=UPI0020284F0B|nr:MULTISPECIES: DUF2889 domain-containing protein [unclassified Caballeronia]